MSKMNKTVACAIFFGVSLFFLFVLILLLLSFSGIEYDEIGFQRRRSSGAVNTDTLYFSGLYGLGPDVDFKIYPSSAHTVRMVKISCTTKDTLELKVSVMFQFFIRPDQLVHLHRKYQLTYEAVIRSAAMEVTKTTAVEFKTEEFIKKRSEVEAAIQNAIRVRLGGDCCDSDCEQYTCIPNCKPVGVCKDMGLMVNARYIHLLGIEVPYKVYYRYLKALVLTEETLKANYLLERAVVEKKIQSETQEIDNTRWEVANNATALSALIHRRATAEAERMVGKAKGEAMRRFAELCGFTAAEHKISAEYLAHLASSSNTRLAVDFNNYVIGGGGGK